MVNSSRFQRMTFVGLLGFSLLSLGAASIAACGDEAPWPDLSGDWAMVQVMVAVADLPVVGQIRINTTVGVLTHATQSGSQVIFQDRYCFTDAKPSTWLFRTDIPDVVMQSIEPAPRETQLVLDECDVRLQQDWYTEVRGAILEDPERESLPTQPDDPRVIDVEGDGHPGMTIHASILGIFSGEGYAVQRYRYQLDGTVFNHDLIVGLIDWTSEQNILAATHSMFMESFTDATDPDPTKHRFVMVRTDGTWTADTLRDRLPELLALMDTEVVVSQTPGT